MENFGHLYILDFCCGTINHIKLTEEDSKFDNTEDILTRYGFNPDNCQYMYCQDELEIIEIENTIK